MSNADETPGVVEAVEALAAHRLVISDFISVIGTCDDEGCDWRKSAFRRDAVEAAHREHVAEVLWLVIADAVRAEVTAAVAALADAWQADLDSHGIRDEDARYCWGIAVRELRAALAADGGSDALDRVRADAGAKALRDAADGIRPGDHSCFKPWCPDCASRSQQESTQRDLRDRADRLAADDTGRGEGT